LAKFLDSRRFRYIDFLEKPFKTLTLLGAVKRAIAIDAADRERIANSKKLAERLAEITRAEHDVLELVLRGETNKEIAATLDISTHTVEDLRARLMQKLKVDTAAELIRLAIQAGLWKPGEPP
jgi:FixJ family two-component response regulator